MTQNTTELSSAPEAQSGEQPAEDRADAPDDPIDDPIDDRLDDRLDDVPDDRLFMGLAIAEAEAAAQANEVPIGAVVVYRGQVIGRGHNRRERDQDPVAHAEIFALREAARALGSWRLEETTLYVTLEPCPMCAGAIVLARVNRLVFGCRDPKAGAARSLYQICDDARLNHRLEVVEGVAASRCSAMLSQFFADIRAGRIEKPPGSSEKVGVDT